MTDIVFMTVVGQNVFSDPWNQTDDIFEEHEPGLLSTIFDHQTSGIFVYNRCGSRVGELHLFSLVPLDPSEVENEWCVFCSVVSFADSLLAHHAIYLYQDCVTNPKGVRVGGL